MAICGSASRAPGSTAGGARIANSAGRRFQRFTELDGLPSPTIYSGVWDDAGYLWLSSSRGLSRLDTELLEFTNYNTSHGLQGDEFNLSSGYRAADGELYFGGVNGFNAFRPDSLGVDRELPQVAITKFLSLNKPVNIADALSVEEPIRLRYDEDVISFEFAAMDFAAPEKKPFHVPARRNRPGTG